MNYTIKSLDDLKEEVKKEKELAEKEAVPRTISFIEKEIKSAISENRNEVILHINSKTWSKISTMFHEYRIDIIFLTNNVAMLIKLITLLFYLIISIPVLVVCLWKKGLYSRYNAWLNYRTKFRVLYLL